MPTAFYQNCRCPACKHPLDDVATTILVCPACGQPLDPAAVWSTRVYPGQIVLPGWVRAFGWPVLLMAAGVAVAAVEQFFLGRFLFQLPVLLIGTGLVFFFIRIFGIGDD